MQKAVAGNRLGIIQAHPMLASILAPIFGHRSLLASPASHIALRQLEVQDNGRPFEMKAHRPRGCLAPGAAFGPSYEMREGCPP
jgi:hypothetical protein